MSWLDFLNSARGDETKGAPFQQPEDATAILDAAGIPQLKNTRSHPVGGAAGGTPTVSSTPAEESEDDGEEALSAALPAKAPPAKATPSGQTTVNTAASPATTDAKISSSVEDPNSSYGADIGDSRLAEAYAGDRRAALLSSLFGGIGSALGTFTESRTGAANNPELWKKISEAPPSVAKEILAQRESSDKSLERKAKASELKEKSDALKDLGIFRKEKQDASSDISKTYREAYREQNPGKVIPDTLSAAALESLLKETSKFNLDKMELESKKASRDAAIAQASESADARIARNNVALTGKHQKTALKESAPLTKLSALRSAAQSYKDNPGAFKSTMLSYYFPKGLDTDSAVKQAETELLGKAGSIPERLRNTFLKALTGKDLGANQAGELLEVAKFMEDTGLEQYDIRMAPIRREVAKNTNLDIADIDPYYGKTPATRPKDPAPKNTWSANKGK